MSDLVGNPEDRFSCVAAQVRLVRCGLLKQIVLQNEPVREIKQFGFMTRSDTDQAVQSQNKARGLKLWIKRNCTTQVAKTKALM